MTDEAINELCNNMATLLILWDGALACLHARKPTEEDYLLAQKFVDQAMKLTRELGYSVTPKYHGAEAHIVQQMRDTMGGLYEFDESWMEQYHQTGYTFDMNLRSQSNEMRKAKVIAANNRRVGHHHTQAARASCIVNILKGRGRLQQKRQLKRRHIRRRFCQML